jgi:hypothetical protein
VLDYNVFVLQQDSREITIVITEKKTGRRIGNTAYRIQESYLSMKRQSDIITKRNKQRGFLRFQYAKGQRCQPE